MYFGSESAGVQECAGDVMGKVSETEGGAAEVFDSAVDGFGGPVAGVCVVEIRQNIVGPAFHGAA